MRPCYVYCKSKKEAISLPAQSLAVLKNEFLDDEDGTMHNPGVWPFKEDVLEMTVLADSYDMTITLLLFSDDRPNRFACYEDDDDDLMDTYQRFQRQR